MQFKVGDIVKYKHLDGPIGIVIENNMNDVCGYGLIRLKWSISPSFDFSEGLYRSMGFELATKKEKEKQIPRFIQIAGEITGEEKW